MSPKREIKAATESVAQSPFEAFVSAILAVPKDAIKEAEGKRPRRAPRKRPPNK